MHGRYNCSIVKDPANGGCAAVSNSAAILLQRMVSDHIRPMAKLTRNNVRQLPGTCSVGGVECSNVTFEFCESVDNRVWACVDHEAVYEDRPVFDSGYRE